MIRVTKSWKHGIVKCTWGHSATSFSSLISMLLHSFLTSLLSSPHNASSPSSLINTSLFFSLPFSTVLFSSLLFYLNASFFSPHLSSRLFSSRLFSHYLSCLISMLLHLPSQVSPPCFFLHYPPINVRPSKCPDKIYFASFRLLSSNFQFLLFFQDYMLEIEKANLSR
jgi:hypothetical protein